MSPKPTNHQSKRLTALAVENARADPSKRREMPDGGSGLYLVVQPKGAKSWALRYRVKKRPPKDDRPALANVGQPRKLTLGTYPAVSLATARSLAAAAVVRVEKGDDPAGEEQAKQDAEKAEKAAQSSLEEAFTEFLDGHTRKRNGKAIRESTKRETARLLGLKRNHQQWIATGSGVLARWRRIKTLQAVTKQDVRDLLKAMGQRVNTNRTLAALKSCFRWHVKQDHLLVSPAGDIDDPAPEGNGRKRILTDEELRALWRAAEAEAAKGNPWYGKMVQVLILSGCRRDEVRGMPRDELERGGQGKWLIDGGRVKNDTDHLVPLTKTMLRLFQSLPLVGDGKLLFTSNGKTPISGLSKIKKRVHEAMEKDLGREIEQWGLHDIRRTFYSGLQQLGFSIEIADACTNHRSGALAGAHGMGTVYGQYPYWTEKQEAFAAWDRHVAQIVRGKRRKPDKPRKPHTRATARKRRATSDKAAPLQTGAR